MPASKIGKILSLLLALLAAACVPLASTPLPGSPTAPAVDPTTAPTADTAYLYEFLGVTFTMDLSLASGAVGQVIPAHPASPDAPYWDVYPQHTRIVLDSYPAGGSIHTPQITVYPLKDYHAAGEEAGKTLDQLAAFLAEQPADPARIPALPLRNAVQAFHSNVEYLPFKNGSGVRFLAFYSQGIVPVNNAEIFYTYQGLTADGLYVVSVILPVSHPDLPATSSITDQAAADDPAASPQEYYANLAEKLTAQPAASFTPDLAKLDALVQSLFIGQY